MKIFPFSFIVVLIIFVPQLVQGQSHRIGVKLEPYVLLTESSDGIPLSYRASGSTFYPLSFYLFYSYQINESYEVQFTPGVIVGSKSFNGIELLTLAKYYWGKNNYAVGGFNVHFNSQAGSLTTKQNAIVFLSVGAGFGLSRIIDLELRYEIPLNNNVISKSRIGNYEGKVLGIFKMGLNFSVDL